MKRLLCLLQGHRWAIHASFPFFGQGRSKYSMYCRRCGKVKPFGLPRGCAE